MIEALCEAERKPIRLIINTPPQHGKSTTVFHWIARALRSFRKRSILYVTYSHDFAVHQMRQCRAIAERAGVRFRSDSRAFDSWHLEGGSTLYAAGVDGSFTGRPGGLIIIDDPIKGWKEAQSRTIRDATYNKIITDITTRAHPDSSIVLVQTRWHEDDIAGRFIKKGWRVLNLPAINDNGQALWPQLRPLEFLYEQKETLGEYFFEALYQGSPKSLGGAIFRGVNYYDRLPTNYRIAIGVDLAYSTKTKADYSVALVLARDGGDFYVVDVVRKQVTAPEFLLSLKAVQSQHPGANMLWHCSGTEKGTADWMRDRGLNLNTETARLDKFSHAQPIAALWNAGKLRVPRDRPWVEPFLMEVLEFTGIGDRHDDQIDAMSSAFDALKGGLSTSIETSIRRESSKLKGFY